jgi:hypothetical protein
MRLNIAIPLCDQISLDVQSHAVADLVDQFDTVNATRAAGSAADFMHQFEQYAGIHIRACTQPRIHAQMQNCEALMGGTHENGKTHRPAFLRDREKGLNALYLTHPYAQTAVLLIDLRHAIGVYGLLNPDADTMLINVEEKELLQGGALLNGQFRRDPE